MHSIRQYEIENTITYKIPFFDVDPMRVVWHGNYFKYFEVSRAALFEKFDLGYLNMEKHGIMLPIIDVKVSYRRSLQVNDEIAVRAYLMECENKIKVGYEILKDDLLCCFGVTTQIAMDAKTKELLFEVPDIIKERFTLKV